MTRLVGFILLSIMGYFPALLIAEEEIAESRDVVAEETSLINIDLNVDFFSAYMFRGLNLYDGTVFQPSVNASVDLADIGTIEASVWYSEGTRNKRSVQDYSEIDYSIGYSKQIDSLSLAVGNLWYTYPWEDVEDQTETKEFYVSLSYDTVLAPTLTFFQDYDAYDNQYYELTLSHDEETDFLVDGLILSPYVTAGFATNSEKVYEKNGLEHITTGLSLEMQVADLIITPSVHYSFKIDDYTVNKFWGGVSLTYSF